MAIPGNEWFSPPLATYYAVITETGQWVPPAGVTSVDVLIVGGGGGGGGTELGSTNVVGRGGGGAGEVVSLEAEPVVPGTPVDIVIGAGGRGYVAGTPNLINTDGEQSSFGERIALGGGRGGGSGIAGSNGGDGGSGGGAGFRDGFPGSAIGSGLGHDGGSARLNSGAGGGGSAGPGVYREAAIGEDYLGGDGGPGVTLSDIGWGDAPLGRARIAGGGGGGSSSVGFDVGDGYRGFGGGGWPDDSGAGDGGWVSVIGYWRGFSAEDSTGSGGGGGPMVGSFGGIRAERIGGDGGSGLVVIRWREPVDFDRSDYLPRKLPVAETATYGDIGEPSTPKTFDLEADAPVLPGQTHEHGLHLGEIRAAKMTRHDVYTAGWYNSLQYREWPVERMPLVVVTSRIAAPPLKPLPPLPPLPPVTPPAPTAPPINFTVIFEDPAVRLRWQQPGAVDYWVVARCTGTACTGFMPIATVLGNETPTFLDENVEAGFRYRYQITAVSAQGEATSGPQSVLVPAPPEPIPVQLQFADGFWHDRTSMLARQQLWGGSSFGDVVHVAEGGPHGGGSWQFEPESEGAFTVAPYGQPHGGQPCVGVNFRVGVIANAGMLTLQMSPTDGFHLQLRDDGGLDIRQAPSGALRAQSAPGVVTEATWHHVEWVVDAQIEGSVQVRVDGNLVVDAAGNWAAAATATGVAAFLSPDLSSEIQPHEIADFYLASGGSLLPAGAVTMAVDIADAYNILPGGSGTGSLRPWDDLQGSGRVIETVGQNFEVEFDNLPTSRSYAGALLGLAGRRTAPLSGNSTLHVRLGDTDVTADLKYSVQSSPVGLWLPKPARNNPYTGGELNQMTAGVTLVVNSRGTDIIGMSIQAIRGASSLPADFIVGVDSAELNLYSDAPTASAGVGVSAASASAYLISTAPQILSGVNAQPEGAELSLGADPVTFGVGSRLPAVGAELELAATAAGVSAGVGRTAQTSIFTLDAVAAAIHAGVGRTAQTAGLLLSADPPALDVQDPEAVAIISAMSPAPSVHVVKAIKRYVHAWKVAGAWDALDYLCPYDVPHEQWARINWKNPQGDLLTLVNAPEHHPWEGWSSDNVSSFAYADLDPPGFQAQDEVHVGSLSTGAQQVRGAVVINDDTGGGNNSAITGINNTNGVRYQGSANSLVANSGIAYDYTIVTAPDRGEEQGEINPDTRIYRNGSLDSEFEGLETADNNGPANARYIRIMRIQGDNYSGTETRHVLAHAGRHIGSHLSAQQVSDIYTAHKRWQFDMHVEQLIARMNPAPTPALEKAIREFNEDLYVSGVWTVIKEAENGAMWVPKLPRAGDYAENARINWMEPNGDLAQLVNSPVEAVGYGYIGDGVSASVTWDEAGDNKLWGTHGGVPLNDPESGSSVFWLNVGGTTNAVGFMRQTGGGSARYGSGSSNRADFEWVGSLDAGCMIVRKEEGNVVEAWANGELQVVSDGVSNGTASGVQSGRRTNSIWDTTGAQLVFRAPEALLSNAQIAAFSAAWHKYSDAIEALI